jgi:hypothetical protein
MDDKTIKARISGEKARVLGNIAIQSERPAQMWWLSFADDDGFRGVCIVHGNEFLEAVMQANLQGCNPHGECRGIPIPLGRQVPECWKNRILTREQCTEFDREMGAKT